MEAVLQALALPDPAVAGEAALWFRAEGGVEVADGYRLAPGARLGFDCYFNVFDGAQWQDACGFRSLALVLEGEGRVAVVVRRARMRGTAVVRDVVAEAEVDLPARLELDGALGDPGVLWLELGAEAGARLGGARWVTEDAPRRDPVLAISITTFRREAEVAAAVARLGGFLAGYEHGGRCRLQVVDNGRAAAVLPGAAVFANPNLGGAGGFVRGMIEARAAGASHCLFMDDDAACPAEAIRRTRALLAHAVDPETAVAGAMLTRRRPHEMWENGATFDGICRPRWTHTDLREPGDLAAMLLGSVGPLPANGYGGWWFFAFPLAAARHLPFPFFLRGDDSGFALANGFSIRTLGGVAAVQAAFGEKETPLAGYFDTRYHLVHHLVFPALARGPLRTALVPLRLVAKSLVRLQYESAEARLMAIRDVLDGPEGFGDGPDAAARRAEIGALTRAERIGPLDLRPTRLRRRGWLRDRLWIGTLNGHLLPGFGWFGARRVVRMSARGPGWPGLGAREIAYVDRANGEGFRVAFDRRRALGLLGQALRLGWALVRRHRALRRAYREAYGALTGEGYWRGVLDRERG